MNGEFTIDQAFVDAVEAVVAQRSARREGAEWRFTCPAHDDAHPSARFHAEKRRWRCDACAAGGGIIDLAQWLDIALPAKRDGVRSKRRGRWGTRSRENNSNTRTAGLTLAAYAASKRLPVEFLRQLGL